jgi:ACR3 family arsenite transporter
MNKLLSFAGRHGPLVLFVGVLLGLVAPPLAQAVKPFMGAAVFVFTLGAFLKVDRPALQAQLTRPARVVLRLLWVVVGVPLVTWALFRQLPLAPATRTGILLCMLAPPVGSAAAMTAMLRLNPALALTVTVATSLLSPVFLPPAALLLGGWHLHLQPTMMMMRIGTVVGGAALVATTLRRFAGRFVAANPQAMTGVSVLGLIVVAVGAMQGMRPQLVSHPGAVATALGVAFAVNAGFQALGAALFARHGAVDALTVGLMSGNRNVTLVWVAVLPWLAQMPGVELYFAAAVFPIFVLPLPLSKLLAMLREHGSGIRVGVLPIATLPIEVNALTGVSRLRSIAVAWWFHQRVVQSADTGSLVALRAKEPTTLRHGQGRTSCASVARPGLRSCASTTTMSCAPVSRYERRLAARS